MQNSVAAQDCNLFCVLFFNMPLNLPQVHLFHIFRFCFFLLRKNRHQSKINSTSQFNFYFLQDVLNCQLRAAESVYKFINKNFCFSVIKSVGKEKKL